MSVLEQKIFDALTPIAEREGVELVEVKIGNFSKNISITLYIYSESGPITLDDCERFHRAVDGPLDDLDPTENKPYTLNVSSLGLDRPIRTDGDFKRNMGKEVTVKFFAPINGKKEDSGFLQNYDSETFTIATGEETRTYKRKETCKISLKLDF